jgi:hypothetical protein
MESSDCIMPSSRKEAPINRVLMCPLFLQFRTASLRKTRNSALRSRRASAARSADGRPRKKINGSASAVIRGILLTRVGCAPPVFTSGLKPSVFLVAVGRHIRTGIGSKEL